MTEIVHSINDDLLIHATKEEKLIHALDPNPDYMEVYVYFDWELTNEANESITNEAGEIILSETVELQPVQVVHV